MCNFNFDSVIIFEKYNNKYILVMFAYYDDEVDKFKTKDIVII